MLKIEDKACLIRILQEDSESLVGLLEDSAIRTNGCKTSYSIIATQISLKRNEMLIEKLKEA